MTTSTTRASTQPRETRRDAQPSDPRAELARFKAGELDYANEVEQVLSKVPEQRRQISELEDR
jgi:hypothetical protein